MSTTNPPTSGSTNDCSSEENNNNDNNNNNCRTDVIAHAEEKDDVFLENEADTITKPKSPAGKDAIENSGSDDDDDDVPDSDDLNKANLSTVGPEESNETNETEEVQIGVLTTVKEEKVASPHDVQDSIHDDSSKSEKNIVVKNSDKIIKKDAFKKRTFSRTSSSEVESNRKDSSSGEFKFLPDGNNKLELIDSTYGTGVIKLKSTTKHVDSGVTSSSSTSSTPLHKTLDISSSSKSVTAWSHPKKRSHFVTDCNSSDSSHVVTNKCHVHRLNSRQKSSCSWHSVGTCSEAPKAAQAVADKESADEDGEEDDDENDNKQDQQQYVVNVHVNPGETFSVCVSDQVQLIQGPATVRMVSNGGPPLPMPMQVPPGHMVQQIIDENGILTNVILSSQPPGLSAPPVVVGYYGNPSNSPHHHHMYPPFGPSHYPSYPPQYPVHHHHMHHHVGQQRMCTTSPNSLHHCNHPQPPPPLPQNPHPNSPHFYPPNLLPPPSHHHFSSSHHEERFVGRGFKSRPPNARPFIKFKENSNNIIRSDHHHHHHPVYFPGPPFSHPPPPHMLPNHLPHRLPMFPYLRNAPPHKINGNTRPRSLSTSSEDQELEEERQAIRDVLSKISPPKVVEIGARCALILLTPPEFNQQDLEVDFSEFIYELHLSEKDESGFNSVYSGDATEITLRDLKPASVYFIKVHSTLDNISGKPSESVSFTTSSCEPDPPQPPKLISKSVSSLFLKWNVAAVDNGSVVTGYSLEFDRGNGDMTFYEIYSGNQRQFKVTKLSPATGYTFRLAALNALGKSDYSRMVCHSTSGTAPSQPDPPMLSESFPTSLTVSWIRRPNDDHFTLMMMDESAEAKGFFVIYSGSGLSFNVSHLQRNSEYKFKLQASNEEGTSEWSDVVKFKTLTDKPSVCGKPCIEGTVTHDALTIIWDPPKDDGGQEVTHYLVHIDDGKSKAVKKCTLRHYSANQLQPGQYYLFKIASVNSVGTSNWSEELKVATKCLPPGTCQQPKLVGKSQPNCTVITWKSPESTGGSAVTKYELTMTDEDKTSSTDVYTGPDTSCTVTSMLPGRTYSFKVRASNEAGAGPWSDPLEVTSGALPPDAPKSPVVICNSPHQAVVSWEEPACNGASIVEYKLEWQQLESEFSQLYIGSDLTADVNDLLAASLYNFRVQAVNSAGCGPFSPVTSCITPPSHPGPITCIQAVSTSNTIRVSWKKPSDNGSKITGYYLSIDDRGVTPLDVNCGFEHVIEDLTPETVYRIKIQALNSIGLGPFSTTLKITTHSPPPSPPTLECAASGCNSLKLKWRDVKQRSESISCSSVSGSSSSCGNGGGGQLNYTLEMMKDDGVFHVLYHGPSHCFKVNKLVELTEYQFRVCSSNQEGQGPYSEVFKLLTSKAPPPVIKCPKVGYITSDACSVEWPGLRTTGQDCLFYILQMQAVFGRDQMFKEIYRGPSTTHRVGGLQPSSEYRLRVCAVRQSKDLSNQELVGSFSQTTSFVTAAMKSSNHVSDELVTSSGSKPASDGSSPGSGWTDQQWAVVLLVCFALFAIFVAFLAQLIISHHQQTAGDSILSSGSGDSSSQSSSVSSNIVSTSSDRRN